MTLYRGIKKNVDDGVKKNRYLDEPRIPSDTHPEIHKKADLWFNDKFGIKARSQTVLVSTNKKQALTYTGKNGTLLEIEPMGNYSLIYSTSVVDFLEHFMDGVYGNKPDGIIDWLESKYYCLVQDVASIPPDFSGEIMLFCEEYNAIAIL